LASALLGHTSYASDSAFFVENTFRNLAMFLTDSNQNGARNQLSVAVITTPMQFAKYVRTRKPQESLSVVAGGRA
jgi:hypothetical protein